MGPSQQLQSGSTRDLSARALVLSLHPDGGGFGEFLRSHADAIDWRWLLGRARAHKVAALLAARVEEHGLVATIEDDFARQFHQIRQEVRSHAATALHTLQRLNEVFARGGVAFFAIKGSVLAEHVYRDPSLRRFVDVDIVTPRAQVPQAESLLRGLGYRFGQVEELLAVTPDGPTEWEAAEALTRTFYERSQYELPFYEPPGGELLPVDLHWHVAPASRLRVDADALWEQAVPVVVGGMKIVTLNPAATLIHLSLHASTCTLAAFRLLHFCDVAWAAARWHDHADALWALAEKWRVTVHVAEVLETLERVFGMQIPLLAGRRRESLRSPLLRQLTATFLTESGRDSDWPLPRRVWAELLWNTAMGCLGSNVSRSARTRLARLQWMAWRWRRGKRQVP